MGSYSYLYDETFEEHQEKHLVKNAWKKMLKNYIL